jgi:hypothetical protein
MAKGADFERDISRTLSLWWSHGERDDIFWRTSMSGGRATVRRKAGKETAYQAGDITATDPVGAPLIKATVIELKRGYGRYCVLDTLDSRNVTTTVLGGFIAQVQEELKQAGIRNFLLICKRDGRSPFVVFPAILNVTGETLFSNETPAIRYTKGDNTYMIITLKEFLACSPAQYLHNATEYNNETKTEVA